MTKKSKIEKNKPKGGRKQGGGGKLSKRARQFSGRTDRI